MVRKIGIKAKNKMIAMMKLNKAITTAIGKRNMVTTAVQREHFRFLPVQTISLSPKTALKIEKTGRGRQQRVIL